MKISFTSPPTISCFFLENWCFGRDIKFVITDFVTLDLKQWLHYLLQDICFTLKERMSEGLWNFNFLLVFPALSTLWGPDTEHTSVEFVLRTHSHILPFVTAFLAKSIFSNRSASPSSLNLVVKVLGNEGLASGPIDLPLVSWIQGDMTKPKNFGKKIARKMWFNHWCLLVAFVLMVTVLCTKSFRSVMCKALVFRCFSLLPVNTNTAVLTLIIVFLTCCEPF